MTTLVKCKVFLLSCGRIVSEVARLDIQALWHRIGTEFRANQGVICRSLHEKEALKPGLDVACSQLLKRPHAALHDA